jgi:peptide-methionine (S)-S-oxide reductase
MARAALDYSPKPTASQEPAPMTRRPFSRLPIYAAAIGLLAISAIKVAPSLAAEDAVVIPPPAADVQKASGIQTAVLSGYAGGSKANAEYQMVSTGTTGHAESVEIKYDPAKISYGKILQIFFSVAHDPTQLNRQGPDTGSQYRSAIFTTSDEQKKVAEAYIAQLNSAGVYKKPIVTKVGPLQAFFAAEAHHQDYLTLHPTQPYIAYNDIPKVENLKKIFAENYSEKPVLVSDIKVTN